MLLAKLRRERIGRHSERLDPGQLALLFETLLTQGGDLTPPDPEAEAREDAELDREIDAAEQAHADTQGTPTSRKARRQAWQTREVERQVHDIGLPPEARSCETCSREMDDIGFDTTHRLEYVPGHFIDHEYHDHKYVCRHCKDGVTTAPAPPQVLKRSAADASVLAHVVVSKYADHTPLHRLHRICARSGAEIPVSTLADWTAGVAELVEPLVACLAERVLGAYIVRTDATGLKVLDAQSAEHNNVCEFQLRDIALGRKNFLFAGSHQAAERAASLSSLTRTCAQYGVSALEYFIDVLRKLGNGWCVNRLEELLPHLWRQEHAPAITR